MEIVVRSLDDINVRSETDVNVWYEVDATLPSCTCKGFQHRGGCKHLKEVRKELEQMGLMSQADQKQKSRRESGVDMTDLPTLYTARYQSQSALSQGIVTPVQTSLGRPKFALMYDLPISIGLITPDWSFLNKEWPQYVPAYLGKLDQMGPEKIARVLKGIARTNGNLPLALCCYEATHGKKADFCHRHLFSQWWEKQTGNKVYELTDEGECLHWTNLPVYVGRTEEFLGGPPQGDERQDSLI